MADKALPVYEVELLPIEDGVAETEEQFLSNNISDVAYEVDIIPLERRVTDRRQNPDAGLPKGVSTDRRKGERRQS